MEISPSNRPAPPISDAALREAENSPYGLIVYDDDGQVELQIRQGRDGFSLRASFGGFAAAPVRMQLADVFQLRTVADLIVRGARARCGDAALQAGAGDGDGDGRSHCSHGHGPRP